MTDAPTPIQQKLDQVYQRSDKTRVYTHTAKMNHYEALLEAGKIIGTQNVNGKWEYDFNLLKDPEKNKAFREALVSFYEEKVKEEFGDSVANDELHKFQLFNLVAGVSSSHLKELVKDEKEGYFDFHSQRIVGNHMNQLSQQFSPYIREGLTPADVESIFGHLDLADKVNIGSATLDDAVAAALRKHERGEIELSWLRDREILKDEHARQLVN